MQLLLPPPAFLLAVACASSAGGGGESSVSGATGCIVGGEVDSPLLSLTRPEADAIVRLDGRTTIGAATEFQSCTGIVIAPSWVLTARHCVDDPERTVMRVTLGETGACDGSNSVLATELVPHETEDLCLLRIPAQTAGDLVPVEYGDDSGLEPGALVELAGFGQTDDGSRGRHFAVEAVSSLDQSSIWVSGDGKSGACAGDSGGPLLTRNGSGSVVALGALSQGSADCLGLDRYVRLSSVRRWLDERTALSE
jgi:S1-C subfamily serine protease